MSAGTGRATALLVLPAALAVLVAGPASAAYTDTAAAGSVTLQGASLADPVLDPSPTSSCTGGLLGLGLLFKTSVVTLTWGRAQVLVDSTSSLRGQAVEVLVAGTYQPAATQASVTASSVTADVIGYTPPGSATVRLTRSTEYTFRVRTLWGGWTSPGGTGARLTSTTPPCS